MQLVIIRILLNKKLHFICSLSNLFNDASYVSIVRRFYYILYIIDFGEMIRKSEKYIPSAYLSICLYPIYFLGLLSICIYLCKYLSLSIYLDIYPTFICLTISMSCYFFQTFKKLLARIKAFHRLSFIFLLLFYFLYLFRGYSTCFSYSNLLSLCVPQFSHS